MHGKTPARDDDDWALAPFRALAVCRNPLQPIHFIGTRDRFPVAPFLPETST